MSVANKNSPSSLIKRVERFLGEIFFPSRCLCCRKLDMSYLCQTCLAHITYRTNHQCATCESINTRHGKPCDTCKKTTPIDAIFSAVEFKKDPLVQKLIHAFKYRFVEPLAVPLAHIVFKATQKAELPKPDILVPTPLHKRRLRERGFNQTFLLAQELVALFSINGTKDPLPVIENLLEKTTHTRTQASISDRHIRTENMKGKIRASQKVSGNPKILNGKVIWLIDDVSTTGSTLFACSKVLKELGAKTVYGVVIAR